MWSDRNVFNFMIFFKSYKFYNFYKSYKFYNMEKAVPHNDTAFLSRLIYGLAFEGGQSFLDCFNF